jgi:MFS transporter, DHA2 family, multidrug resistance protein
MITFRAFQGAAGGILIPMAFTNMLISLPPSKQPIGMALFGIVDNWVFSECRTFLRELKE